MHARTIAAAVLSSLALVLLAVEVYSWPQSARFGPTAIPDSACSMRIVDVPPTEQASGLQEGDRLLLPRMDRSARIAVVFQYAATPTETGRAGETVGLVVQRGERVFPLSYLLRHTDSTVRLAAQLGFKFFIVALGIFVLWRGRDRAALVLGIWCMGVAVALPDAWWGALGDSGRLAGGALTSALWTYSPFMLYLVVESIATGVSRRAIIIARTLMVIAIAPSIIVNTVNTTASAHTGCSTLYLAPWSGMVNALFTGSQLVIIGFFLVSYLRTTGLARQRLRWLFWAFLISRFGVLLNLFNRLAVHPIHLSGVEWLTVMIFPLGCAYAILRHRIIDVSFVLNRTLVYTILTTLVVGIFILVEYVLNAIAVSRGVGLAVELLVALALGLSFNALHKRVEGALERTLFRRKFEAQLALQQLADEAAYTENAQALVSRAMAEIPRAMGAAGAAIYERRDGVYTRIAESGLDRLPSVVDVDDLAFVRLRTRMSQVDLSEVASALGSDAIAFPLVVRGQVTGALVCGRRRNGESYAPDEMRMLGSLTHEIAAELHAIRARERAELLVALTSGQIDVATARARMATLG